MVTTASVIGFVNAHPTMMAAIVWPAITAVVTWVTRKRTEAEYIAMNPRLSAVLKMIGALGLDAPKLVRQLQQIVTGKPVMVPGFRAIVPDEISTNPAGRPGAMIK